MDGADATPRNDATVTQDGGEGGDAATDQDAQVPPDQDLDEDGYPASQDCDDLDSSVIPGVVRDCATDCDTGTQTCLLDGTWSQCTARSDCDCTSPGETRVIECGNCGQATQECGLDLIWATTGPCINEGPCSPGAQDQVTCDYCGSGVRICQNDCTWGPPDCTGVCTPGDHQITADGCGAPYERQERECDSGCQWNVLQPCTADCLLPARQGNGDYTDEICIPGGPFLMGRPTGEGIGNENPIHEVSLSAYFIDKYEVTYGRYRQCVDAAACPAPTGPGAPLLYDPAKANLPVGRIPWTAAHAFCQWDGGRSLPTEAQWEKAARGPAPREVLNPWGINPANCAVAVAEECAQVEPWPVDSTPAGASYYGVLGMGGNVHELVGDYYSDTYYAQGPTVDPPGPLSGTHRVVRGYSFYDPLSWMEDSVTRRWYIDPASAQLNIGFRCARPGF